MTRHSGGARCEVRAVAREFAIPDVGDAFVVGHDAPLGWATLSALLARVAPGRFDAVDVVDDVVAGVFVRRGILRRLPGPRLIAFVLEQVKPLVGRDECVRLDIDVEVELEAS